MRPIFLLIAALLLTAACGQSPSAATPTAPAETVQALAQAVVVTVTPMATSRATLLPPATPSVALPATLAETTSILALAPFTLTLPVPWSALQPRPDEWARQVELVATHKPYLAASAAALLAMQPITPTILLAWPLTDTPAITLVGAVTPAEDVTLQQYLAAAAAELQQPSAATGVNITVQQATIRYDLHPAHWPLAILHYTLQASDPTLAPITTGYQVMTLDKTGANLLLLTFTIHEAQPEATLAVVESIVATLQE